MINLIRAEDTPLAVGVSMCILEDGDWHLIVVSSCCGLRVSWETDKGSHCSICITSCMTRGFTDNSIRLEGSSEDNLIYWIQAWTGLSGVGIKVEL